MSIFKQASRLTLRTRDRCDLTVRAAYSDIDPRQRAEIFRLASEVSVDSDFQYIATVNQDQIDAVRGILGEADFDRIIVKNTVLELKDDSPKDKLLGIEVDVSYD